MKRLVCLALLLLFMPACDDAAPGGQSCIEHRDCPLPTICIAGACELECRRDLECSAGALCIESVCQNPDRCTTDQECEPFGMVCDRDRGACVSPASVCDDVTNPCADGLLCQGGRCVTTPNDMGIPVDDAAVRIDEGLTPDEGLRLDQGLLDEGIAQDQGVVLDQSVTPDEGIQPDLGLDCPDGAGAYGTRCLRGGDCQSGFCVENKQQGYRTCTTLCDVSAECPSLDVCLLAQMGPPTDACPPPPGAPAVGEIVGVCVPNETGIACSGPQDCTEGLCITPPQAMDGLSIQPICSTTCEDDRKCPRGFSCQDLPNQSGGVTRACAPAVEIFECQDGDPVTCGGVCQTVESTFCISPNDGVGLGYCSCACADASQCPLGFGCLVDPNIPSGDPARPGVCLAMSGYRCANEAVQPDRFTACPSMICAIDDERPNDSFCTIVCRDEADCPVHHLCQEVEPGLGICQPAQ